jgi:hypothetical protein
MTDLPKLVPKGKPVILPGLGYEAAKERYERMGRDAWDWYTMVEGCEETYGDPWDSEGKLPGKEWRECAERV